MITYQRPSVYHAAGRYSYQCSIINQHYSSSSESLQIEKVDSFPSAPPPLRSLVAEPALPTLILVGVPLVKVLPDSAIICVSSMLCNSVFGFIYLFIFVFLLLLLVQHLLSIHNYNSLVVLAYALTCEVIVIRILNSQFRIIN